MSSIIETLNKIRDEFSIFIDPRDKYIFLVDLFVRNELDKTMEKYFEENSFLFYPVILSIYNYLLFSQINLPQNILMQQT